MPTSASATNPRNEALMLMEKRKDVELEIETITSRLCKPGGPGIKGNLLDKEGFPRADIDIPAVRADRYRLAGLHYDHKEITAKIERLIHAFHATVPPTPSSSRVAGTEVRKESSAVSPAVLPLKRTANGEDVKPDHSRSANQPTERSALASARPSSAPSPSEQSEPQGVAGGPQPMEADGGVEGGENASTSVSEVLQPFAVVDEVTVGSPGQIDGLKVGDSFLRFGSVTFGPDCINQVAAELRSKEGRDVETQVLRRGLMITLTVTPRPWSGRGLLGCHLRPL